jgi:dTMP kinase
MGLFLVFEGIEGCGKTTQVALLGTYLESRRLACVATREPGGTSVGEEIRKIFLHSNNREITPLTELLLVTASRIQHVHQVIQPALAADRIVLCDRFFDATVAYQGYAGGLELDLIYRTHELFLASLTPDLTLLLDCPVEVGLGRSRSRNAAAGRQHEDGRFEAKDLEFHGRVRQGYLAIAGREPGRFRIIDARQSVAQMHQDVCAAVAEKLQERGYAV